MTTAQRLSPKTKERSEFSILTGEGRESMCGDGSSSICVVALAVSRTAEDHLS